MTTDRFEDRVGLAAKITWEGGIGAALDWGITAADMPDAELEQAWGELEAASRHAVGSSARAGLRYAEAVDTVRRLLSDAFADPDVQAMQRRLDSAKAQVAPWMLGSGQ